MQKPMPSRVAAILREARTLLSKSQEHVAAEAQVSLKTVRRAETEVTVSGESLRALCSVLDLDVSEVLERSAAAPGGCPEDEAWRVAPEYPGYERMRSLSSTAWGVALTITLCMMAASAQSLHSGGTVPTRPDDTLKAEWAAAVTAQIVLGMFLAGHLWHGPVFAIFWPARLRPTFKSRRPPIAAASTRIGRLLLANGAFSLSVVALAAAFQAFHPQSGMSLMVPVPVCATTLQALVWDRALVLARKAELDASERMAAMAAWLPDIRSSFARFGSAAAEAALPRLREMVVTAVRAGREQDAEPLAWFIEDLARGISGKKALDDYLRVAEESYVQAPSLRGLRKNREIDLAKGVLASRISSLS